MLVRCDRSQAHFGVRTRGHTEAHRVNVRLRQQFPEILIPPRHAITLGYYLQSRGIPVRNRDHFNARYMLQHEEVLMLGHLPTPDDAKFDCVAFVHFEIWNKMPMGGAPRN